MSLFLSFSNPPHFSYRFEQRFLIESFRRVLGRGLGVVVPLSSDSIQLQFSCFHTPCSLLSFHKPNLPFTLSLFSSRLFPLRGFEPACLLPPFYRKFPSLRLHSRQCAGARLPSALTLRMLPPSSFELIFRIHWAKSCARRFAPKSVQLTLAVYLLFSHGIAVAVCATPACFLSSNSWLSSPLNH